MLHWKKFTDRDFISAVDLTDDNGNPREVVLTIAAVEQGELARAGTSKKDRKPVLRFHKTPKRFVLNSTNAKTLEELFTADVRAWKDRRICLFPSTTNFGPRKNIPCVRIRNRVPGQNAPEGEIKEQAATVQAEFSGAPAQDGAAA